MRQVRTSPDYRRCARRSRLLRRAQVGTRFPTWTHVAEVAATTQAPLMSEVCNPQRVFNIYCDLADGTLPPDLWNESAELAAMVYVAVHYPAQAALSRLLAAVSNFNRVNRSLGLPQLSFDAEQVERKLTAVSRYVSSLPDSMHVGAIYRTLLMTARVEHLPSAGKSAAVPAAGLDA